MSRYPAMLGKDSPSAVLQAVLEYLLTKGRLPSREEMLNDLLSLMAKALDRDRAVDESGNQIAVFGRVGARPLTLEEQRRMYLHNGRLWRVSDDPADSVYPRPRPFDARRPEEGGPPTAGRP